MESLIEHSAGQRSDSSFMNYFECVTLCYKVNYKVSYVDQARNLLPCFYPLEILPLVVCGLFQSSLKELSVLAHPCRHDDVMTA